MLTSPLTDRPNVTSTEKIPTQKLIAGWKSELGIDIAREVDGVESIEVLRCNDTGLVFFSPNGIAGSAKLYEELQEIDWYYTPHKWEHDIAMRALLQCPSGARVLDVGCGFGSFVQMCIDAGFDTQGIELNAAAVSVAKRRGLPVAQESLEALVARSPESLDAIFAFQVLEHVERPRAFIQSCIDALKPGGVLFFGVPNSRGYLGYTFDLLDLPPHHMSRWSPRTFRSLEKLFPLTLVQITAEPIRCDQSARCADSICNQYFAMKPVGAFGLSVKHLARGFIRRAIRHVLDGHTICAQFTKTRQIK